MKLNASISVSRGDCGKHEVLEMATLRNIRIGKELFVDLGEKFIF